MVCDVCGVLYKESEENRIFLNCQKVEAYLPEISKKTHLWLLEGFLNKLKPGMRFNGVCYYDINIDYRVENSRYFGILHEYFVLISANLYITVLNKGFFENLTAKISKNTQKMQNMLNSNILFEQWLMIKYISNICIGSYILPDDTLIAYKMAILSSIMLKHRAFLSYYGENTKNLLKTHENSNDFLSISDEFNLHLFFIADNEAILVKVILDIGGQLENFGLWPYNSDDNTLYEFLMHMQNGIIFIPDAGCRLRKHELYLITKILRREEIELPNKEKFLMNTTLWIYGTPNIKTKENGNILTIRDIVNLESFDNIDIIIDISRKNANFKRIRHEKFDNKVSDKLLDYFQQDNTNECPLGRKTNIIYNNGENEDILKVSKKSIQNDYHQEHNDSMERNPVKLMQAYFKLARKAKCYSIVNYNSFRKTCFSISLIRNYYINKSNLSKPHIELIDVLIGIMLDELTTSNKYKETERVNSVVFGTVKASKIGSFWLDCEEVIAKIESENKNEILLDFKKDEFLKGVREREKQLFEEIIEEIMELCGRNDRNNNEGI